MQVTEPCQDVSWQFSASDIVCGNADCQLFRVIQLGWGDYEREVRLTRMSEDTRKRESGRWVRTDRCYKLEIDDCLVVTGTIKDASEQKRILPKGPQVQFKGFDSYGDVMLWIDHNEIVIFRKDLDPLYLT